MDHLEQHDYLKIQDIVEKLHKLDCPLIGNQDDAWIMELLFEPEFHRYKLIEWILSKFGYDVEPSNSTERRIKNLKSTLSEWGLLQENSDNVFKGTAAVKEQFQFWSSLVDLMWTKYKITSSITMTDGDDGIFLTPEKSVSKAISYEFEETCSAVDKLVKSGNLQYIFKHDIQLLAPDVASEIKNISPSKLDMLETSHSQRLKELTKGDNKRAVALRIYKKLSENKIPIKDCENDDNSEAELNKLEEEMLKVSTNLQNIAQGAFNDVYEDLKPLILNAKADDFVDVGLAFQKVEPLLKEFLELNKSFPKLESTNLILSKVNSELKDLLNQDTLVDENYIQTFRLLED